MNGKGLRGPLCVWSGDREEKVEVKDEEGAGEGGTPGGVQRIGCSGLRGMELGEKVCGPAGTGNWG